MKKIYLACPYSHADMEIVERRVMAVNAWAGKLMRQGHCVFSPLSHSHPIAMTMVGQSHMDTNFWLAQDLPMLVDWADEMWVLKLEGWEQSKGIHIETVAAWEFDIPVYYIDPKTGELG